MCHCQHVLGVPRFEVILALEYSSSPGLAGCAVSLLSDERKVERRLEVKREVLVELQRLIPLKLWNNEISLVR